jgi:hypothetical protein
MFSGELAVIDTLPLAVVGTTAVGCVEAACSDVSVKPGSLAVRNDSFSARNLIRNNGGRLTLR